MIDVDAIQNAIDYMEAHITEELEAADIAGRACMSVFYFQRIFSALCGCTVGEYLRNRRLSLAAEALLSSEKTILDIAVQYGYGTAEGFLRAFHRYFGITPSAARGRRARLPKFEKIHVRKMLAGGLDIMDDLTRYGRRGYYVKENAPVYMTKDMDKTCAWFRDVLGWYGEVCARDEHNVPVYGCVFDYPGELIDANLTIFKGIHLFTGEPRKDVAGFLCIKGIDAFYQYVRAHGWDEITEITEEPWGARVCCVTTIDGSVLRFFETI